MSSTTFARAVTPAAIKSLFRSQLPNHRSGQISEAIARSCGYQTHASYIADLKDGVGIRYEAAAAIDLNAFGERLAELVEAPLEDVTSEAFKAMAAICQTVQGPLVPIGPNSKLDATAHQIVFPIDFGVEPTKTASLSRIDRFRLPVPDQDLGRWWSRINHLLHIVSRMLIERAGGDWRKVTYADLRARLRFRDVMDAFENQAMSDPLRKSILVHLSSLPDWSPEKGLDQEPETIEAHERVAGFARNAVGDNEGPIFLMFALQHRGPEESTALETNGAGGLWSDSDAEGATFAIMSLMDDGGADGKMWKGRANVMLSGVMRALAWLHGQGEGDLKPVTIRSHLGLDAVIALADPGEHEEMPDDVRNSIRSYLRSLPGYQEERGRHQVQTTRDQHGYLETQFGNILSSIKDVHGRIFDFSLDLDELPNSEGALVMMLPDLKDEPSQIRNLLKIVEANLRTLRGASLDSVIKGSWKDVEEASMLQLPSYSMPVLDEWSAKGHM